MYDIGKGVKPEDLAPATGRPQGRSSKYPIAELQPGEHFIVRLPDDDEQTRRRKVRTLQRTISRFRKTHPERRFSVRYSPGENALYVIRTEKDILP